MAEAFIVRRGGGGSGGTLVVTSSGAGTVTVSNSTLGKSYSKTVTAGGSVTFKGLKTGTWTVTLSNGTQPPATKTVTINADYSTSIAYFAATISITYPANSTCTVKTSGGTTVASDSNTGSSAKTWTATVNSTGTYTVTATATDGSGKSKSTTVSVTADGQSESVTLTYITYLYQAGDTNTGFLSVAWAFISDAYEEKPTIAYETDSAVFTAPTGGRGSTSGVVYFPDKIDLTPYTTLTADATLSGSINPDVRPEGLYIWNTIGSGYYQAASVASALFGKTGNKILTIDVSELSGEYYIGFGLRYENTPVEKITLREVALE